MPVLPDARMISYIGDHALQLGFEGHVARHRLPVAVESQADQRAAGIEHRRTGVSARNVEVGEEQILFFAEGAPYTSAGLSILSGHENRQAVKDVVNYFYSDIIDDYLSTYLPEQIKVGQVNTTPNYPTDIPYADMSNNTPNVKAELLAKWTH